MWSAWASGRVTPTEVLDIGDGRVLVRADWGGTGSASGLETHAEISQIFTIQDGQLSRVDYFFDHDKALEAVGWRECQCGVAGRSNAVRRRLRVVPAGGRAADELVER